VRLNEVLESLQTYPFTRLTDARRDLQARGVEVVDFGIGEPREQTPEFIRRALCDAIGPMSTYPLAEGLPELREAVAAWIGRRFGVAVDPATEIVPTLGSKEVVFGLVHVVGSGAVGVTTPGYPVAERGARFAGRDVVQLELRAERGFLPDLDAVPWDELALLWVNYPNNPTAATAPVAFYADLLDRARAHDVVVASDEAYSELYFGDEPPASALQAGGLENLLVCNTLSKRSSMPGYRSGFVAGDPRLIAALKRYRPNVGVTPQEFVQRAAVAAWGDEAHVDEVRARYRAKRDVLGPALDALGLRVAGGDATFFEWRALPEDWTAGSEAYALALLEHGVVVAPGAFFGPAGEGYVRVALVPSLAECERAAELLRGVELAPPRGA
jgi:acetylornithine aminotransferase